jgi:hypothetical protein
MNPPNRSRPRVRSVRRIEPASKDAAAAEWTDYQVIHGLNIIQTYSTPRAANRGLRIYTEALTARRREADAARRANAIERQMRDA